MVPTESLFQEFALDPVLLFQWILNEETSEVTLTDCVHNATVSRHTSTN